MFQAQAKRTDLAVVEQEKEEYCELFNVVRMLS